MQKARKVNPHQVVNHDKWKASLQTKENRERVSKAMLGVPKTTDKCRRLSPRHAKAIDMMVRSPSGTLHHVLNTRAFVSQNENLFSPDDVIWRIAKQPHKSIYCRASNGLASLHRNVNTRLSWKGWTLA